MKRSLPGVCRGFTLIELLVSVAIGGVLIGAALASYRGMGTKQQVKQAGISLAADLKSYQQKALAGQKPSECTAALQGYQVTYVDSNSYSVTAVCAGAPSASEFDLPGEVIFQTAFNPGEIFFPVLSGAVDGAQTLVLTQGDYSYQVVVEAAGVIRGEML